MKRCFMAADILLPNTEDMEKWAVIACDQHTSDIGYWRGVRSFVEDHFSTLHMILPEAELALSDENTVSSINAYMHDAVNRNALRSYANAYIYVERTLLDGSIRQGVVGMVDLEDYDYVYSEKVKLCATEETVMERIPPRARIRKDADLEFSHIIIFCDDEKKNVIEPLAQLKENFPKLYDFDLMFGGGHITGWLVAGEDAKQLDAALDAYENESFYMVSDGNHSLVTAKQCYEARKNMGGYENGGPARYALVELENINSPAIVFEPIHRLLMNVDADKLFADMTEISAPDGTQIPWYHGDKHGVFTMKTVHGEMPVATLQKFLDAWLKVNPGEIDYVHGDDTIKELSASEANVGFCLPRPQRKELFAHVMTGTALPRKTFSLGHACEKRYYLEGRKIK